MMRAAQARGHSLSAIDQAAIFWDNGVTQARVQPLRVGADNHAWYSVGEAQTRTLASFSAVLMRKDPPFDMEYVYSTYLLEAAERAGIASKTVKARDWYARMMRTLAPTGNGWKTTASVNGGAATELVNSGGALAASGCGWPRSTRFRLCSSPWSRPSSSTRKA